MTDQTSSEPLRAQPGAAADQDSEAALVEFLRSELRGGRDHGALYRALAHALERALEDGLLAPGSALPGERILAQSLGLSRVTIRNALEELTRNGILLRRAGARSAIARRVEKKLSTLVGFSDEITARGMTPSVRWLSRKLSRPTPAEAMALGLAPDQRVARLQRLRFADGIPIAIERAAVPAAILPSVDLVRDSLYATLEELGSRPSRGTQRIRAGVMSEHEADLLSTTAGKPILIVERRCLLADGTPAEFTETRYNGEIYDFVMELQV